MMTTEIEATDTGDAGTKGTRSLRRQVAKPAKSTSRSRSISAKSVKKGIYLTVENARRLSVTSAFDFRSDSDIINELIEQHLRGLVVSDRRASCPSQDTESAESPVSL